MSKFISGLIGASALLVAVGATQLALGENLIAGRAQQSAAQSGMVNRAAKADRPVGIVRDGSQTFVTHVGAANDMSVAIRVPQVDERRDSALVRKPSKRPVACEASASVLTEIAKVMESARCVT